MVKHNNALQLPHLRKNWQPNVKTFFNQPAQKKKRLEKRRSKAKEIFPRPIKSLRPVVRKPTQRYSAKTRLGRGFTLQEVKEAGLNAQFARSIGIMVDHRRTNKSAEGLQANVNRLKNYIDKVVLLPKKEGKPKRGNCGFLSDATDKTQLVQNKDRKVLGKPKQLKKEKVGKITPEMNKFRPSGHIRQQRADAKWAGKRSLKVKKEEK